MSKRTISIIAVLGLACGLALLVVIEHQSARHGIGVAFMGVTQVDFGEVMGQGSGPTDWLVVSIRNTGSRTVTLQRTVAEVNTEAGWEPMLVHITPVRGRELRPGRSTDLKLEALTGTEPRRIAIQYFVAASPSEWLSVRLRDVWSSGKLPWLTRPVVRTAWATNAYRLDGSAVIALGTPP